MSPTVSLNSNLTEVLMTRRELMKYLPPNEVPAVSAKKRSLGPSNSHVMETPSPILYKRCRADMEGVEMQNSVKRLKEDSEEKVRTNYRF